MLHCHSENWLLGAAPSSLRNFTKEPLFSQGVLEATAGSSLEETSNNRQAEGGLQTGKPNPEGSPTRVGGVGGEGNAQHHLGGLLAS